MFKKGVKMKLDKDRKERLKWIYQAEGNKDLEARYDLWAKEYDEDVASYGYKIPGIVTGLLGRFIQPDDGAILDAGAGTGIMGEIMFLLGYKDLVAIDLCTKNCTAWFLENILISRITCLPVLSPLEYLVLGMHHRSPLMS